MEQKYVIVSKNTEGDVCTIRPSQGGPELTVNRKLLIIDPWGKEPDDEEPVFWSDDSSSDVDSNKEEETSLFNSVTTPNIYLKKSTSKVTYNPPTNWEIRL